jgi:hypothetical protein
MVVIEDSSPETPLSTPPVDADAATADAEVASASNSSNSDASTATTTSTGGSAEADAPEEKPVPAPKEVPFDEERSIDEDYLKSYFSQVDSALRRDSSNPTVLFDQLWKHLVLALEDRETVFSKGVFRVLVTVVTTVMERSYPHQAWLDAALNFQHRVLGVLVDELKDGQHSDELLRTLEKFLWRKMEFYTEHGREDFTDALRPKYFPGMGDNADTRCADIHQRDLNTSYFLVQNLISFQMMGGFDAFLSRISDLEHKLPAASLYTMLKMLDLVRHDLRRAFLATYAPELLAAMRTLISSFTLAEQREQGLDSICNALNLVARMADRARLPKLREEIELFKLAQSLAYVQLPYLEASIKGIEQITNMVRIATGEYQSSRQHRSSYDQRSQYGRRWHTSTTWMGPLRPPHASTFDEYTAIVGGQHRRSGAYSDDDEEHSRYSDPELDTAADDGTPTAAAPATGGKSDGETPSEPREDGVVEGTEPAELTTEDAAVVEVTPIGEAVTTEEKEGGASATVNEAVSEEESPSTVTDIAEPAESDDSTTSSTTTAKSEEPKPAAASDAATSSTATTSTSAQKKKNTSIITKQFMLDWLSDNGVIDIIFKVDHPGALKQGLNE